MLPKIKPEHNYIAESVARKYCEFRNIDLNSKSFLEDVQESLVDKNILINFMKTLTEEEIEIVKYYENVINKINNSSIKN